MRRIVDSLVSVLLAADCAACGNVLEQPTRGAVCEHCWEAIARLTPPVCDACGLPLSPRRGGSSASFCPRCELLPPQVAKARSVAVYEGTIRDILHALKYSKRPSLARHLAAMMTDAGAEVLRGADAVIPVPLHPSRLRDRGFNQAALLARHLPLPVTDLLVRTRSTASQADLPAEARHSNVAGAFALKWGHSSFFATQKKIPMSVVLVDDVATTGATLNECARVLRQAGVHEVRALTVARAVR